jgi:hypothetical protein
MKLIKFLKTWAVTRMLWMLWPSILLLVIFLYLNSTYTIMNWRAIHGGPWGFRGTDTYILQGIGWMIFFSIPFVQWAYILVLARFEK